jgi:serine/threonine protein kinase
VCALKTFRDELLANPAAREAFKKEALLWVNLGEHPFILAARWVEEAFGRLFVAMDYIAPDAEGRVSLADHLAHANGRLDTNQILEWAIQFCIGMEHANSRGIECHRDIKPANILISRDGILKISDFGLASAAEAAWRQRNGHGVMLAAADSNMSFGFSLIETDGKKLCGTPGYMPPEVLRGESPDRRSDIYSFGLVLWQMAAGSPVLPFLVSYRGDMQGYLTGVSIDFAKLKSTLSIEDFKFLFCKQVSLGDRGVWQISPCMSPKRNLILVRKSFQEFNKAGAATSSRLKCLDLFDFNAISIAIEPCYSLTKLPKFVFMKFLTNRMHFWVRCGVSLPLLKGAFEGSPSIAGHVCHTQEFKRRIPLVVHPKTTGAHSGSSSCLSKVPAKQNQFQHSPSSRPSPPGEGETFAAFWQVRCASLNRQPPVPPPRLPVAR